MHYLQKEKELENRLKLSETEAELYKSRLESVMVELNQKKGEISSLRSMFQELQNEKNTIKVSINDTNKQRIELEEKNLLLKGDIMFNQELQKAKKDRILKRTKSDRTIEVVDESIDSSLEMDETPSVDVASRLIELELQLRELNERRDAEVTSRDKEIIEMKKDLKILNSQYKHLYETKMALSTDLMAYRKLIHLEDQSCGSGSKKRRTTDSCQDESEKDESLAGSSSSSKQGDH